MTTAQSLHKQFTQRVRELNDQGLQLHDIELDAEVKRLGIALWGATALRNQIRTEIRRALQRDIDQDTKVRNRISLPKQTDLPMPRPEPVQPNEREYVPTVTLNPERELIAVQENIKVIMGHIRKCGLYVPDEIQKWKKTATAVYTSAKKRLVVNGSSVD